MTKLRCEQICLTDTLVCDSLVLYPLLADNLWHDIY